MILALALSAALHAEAQRVTITRDDWGIAHVHGKTDADAVNRVESNYLTALGRVAEAQGESAIYQDLRERLFVESAAIAVRSTSTPTNCPATSSAPITRANNHAG